MYFSGGEWGGGCLAEVALVPGEDLLLDEYRVCDGGPVFRCFGIGSFWVWYFYHGEATGGFGLDTRKSPEHLFGFEGSMELVFEFGWVLT